MATKHNDDEQYLWESKLWDPSPSPGMLMENNLGDETAAVLPEVTGSEGAVSDAGKEGEE